MNSATAARARRLRDLAHELNMKGLEYQAIGYALEQKALDLVSEKWILLVAPAILSVNEPVMQSMKGVEQ